MTRVRSSLIFILHLAIFSYTHAQILRVDKNHLESDSAGYRTLTVDINYSMAIGREGG